MGLVHTRTLSLYPSVFPIRYQSPERDSENSIDGSGDSDRNTHNSARTHIKSSMHLLTYTIFMEVVPLRSITIN